ncbi:MAG TPA: hypothetical protein DD458_20530 [Prolixibacteraceae bacterium]|nr:hypothetical protein [Prolixibacteraceae bacterium]HCB62755.1 hypothetical protein [Bacteroidales bacterium]HCR89918.1 hypothetical protein [Prolixibacteraceae bacterium]
MKIVILKALNEKRDMIRKIILLLAFALTTAGSFAESTQFTMSAPNVVRSGEQFRLSFTLNDSGSDLQLPDLSNFEILMGPSTSQSSSFQMINGRTTQSVSFSYIYVLRAKAEGTFTIRPASINVNGKVFQSNSLEIQVVKGQQGQAAPQGGSQQGQQNQQSQQQENVSADISKDDLFVKVDITRNNVFKGEQIIATVKLYVSPNVPVRGFNDVKLPSYEGFWTQDIEVPNQISFAREVYDNKIYQVGVMKKTILFPQQTGTIKIDPFEITCIVQQRIRQQRSFFDDFFDNYRNVEARVTSTPVYIKVKDLPPAPASFYGAVGSFNYTADIDKEKLRSNEAATLKITVTGTGNLKLIEAPKVEFPTDFEKYDPKTSDRVNASDNGLSGSKTFEYLFIPRYAGEYTIPAVVFSYFNTASQKYETRSAGPFNIHVEKGDDDQNATVMSSISKEDVRFIGKDIRFIKQNQQKLTIKGHTFFGTTGFYLVYLIGILLFAAVYFVYRKKARENANLALMRNKQANKVARKRLKEAASFLKNNKAEEFYESVLKAFWGYLSDKLAIPVADLNRDNASSTLLSRQVQQETIEEFIRIIDDCEFARYAPSAFSGTIQDVYDRAASVMGKLEKQIK